MTLLLLPIITHAALLALVLFSSKAHADHHTCGYTTEDTNHPEFAGFTKFCDAVHQGYIGPHAPHGGALAQYFCNNTQLLVADWNVLRERILECATPCNGGGFARETACDYSTWAVCASGGVIGSSQSCHVLDRFDDCEWPLEFNVSQIPTSMSVWHK